MILELKKIFYNIFKLKDHQFDVSARRHGTQHNDTRHQGDQIGRNFALWAIFYGIGQIFI
jgi:hypothetical protein